MLKKIRLSLSFGLAALISCSVYSSSSSDDASLSNQCHLLAQNLNELIDSQITVSCKYKLTTSSRYVDISGDKIIQKRYLDATEYLLNALDFLNYAEKFPCERVSEITAIKKELIQIKKQIILQKN